MRHISWWSFYTKEHWSSLQHLRRKPRHPDVGRPRGLQAGTIPGPCHGQGEPGTAAADDHFRSGSQDLPGREVGARGHVLRPCTLHAASQLHCPAGKRKDRHRGSRFQLVSDASGTRHRVDPALLTLENVNRM